MRRVLSDGVVPVKVWADEIEETALEQLRNLSQVPFVHKHVAVMPDVHAGYGSTVGSVIPTKAAIIPAAIGVDIGCAMMAQRLPLTASDLPDNLSAVRFAIEAAIPNRPSAATGGLAEPATPPTVRNRVRQQVASLRRSYIG